MLSSGQLLADRYRLGHRIAVGGMGEVWQAVDIRLDRTVAIKVLKAELCGDAEFLHRFRTEARTTASLNHPGIAAVHDYGETAAVPDGQQDTAYLVMELVEGEPLATILAREGRINTDHTVDMLEQAGRALQAAHERGLVHRDVKPGNILIGPDGTVKLTDFGIAKAADAAPVTRSGMVMGTAHYIAPEQALGSEASPSSDVYSLTVVGYECLMGHRPFLSDNAVTVAMMHIRDIAPPLPADVPPGVRALIETTLVKDPRRRYATGGEFANAVACVRAGMPLPTPAALVQQQPVPGVGTGTHQPVVRPNTPQPGNAQSGMPQQAAAQQRAPQQVPAQQLPPQQPAPQQGMGGTFPPGVIPPQPAGHPGQPPRQPAAQQPAMPGGPAALGRQSRTVFWVLVAVFTIILLVVVGLATYWTVSRSEGSMHDVGSTSGVEAAQSISTVQRAPASSAPPTRGDGGANEYLDPEATLGHTSPQHAFVTGRETVSRTDPARVGGTSHTAREPLTERGSAA